MSFWKDIKIIFSGFFPRKQKKKSFKRHENTRFAIIHPHSVDYNREMNSNRVIELLKTFPKALETREFYLVTEKPFGEGKIKNMTKRRPIAMNLCSDHSTGRRIGYFTKIIKLN